MTNEMNLGCPIIKKSNLNQKENKKPIRYHRSDRRHLLGNIPVKMLVRCVKLVKVASDF